MGRSRRSGKDNSRRAPGRRVAKCDARWSRSTGTMASAEPRVEMNARNSIACVGMRRCGYDLLGAQANSPRDARYRRRVPFSSERLRFRGVDAHGQVELAFRGWEPVCFLVLAGAPVLEIEVERSVCVVLKRHPTADRKSIERVRDLEALGIIECD